MWAIKCKMDRRPILNSDAIQLEQTVELHSGDAKHLDIPTSGTFRLSGEPGLLHLRVQPKEPGDEIGISCHQKSPTPEIRKEICSAPFIADYDRTANATGEYLRAYRKKQK